MIRVDLEKANIPYEVDGEVFDFHALRHTFITNLANFGVHPKDAQILARHSDIKLTMDYYTHTDKDRERGAVNKLPPAVCTGLWQSDRVSTCPEPSPVVETGPAAEAAELLLDQGLVAN